MTDTKTTLDNTIFPSEGRIEISPDALAALGGHEWAYVRPMKGKDLRARVPGAPEVAPDMLIFAIFRADGTPVALADSAQAAYANIAAQDLSPVTVH